MTEPHSAIITDAFARVLGARRGSGRSEDEPEHELSALDRARQFVEFTNTTWFESVADAARAERELAAQLGLSFSHGQWQELQDGDHEREEWPLTALFYDSELLGYIGHDEGVCCLFVHDHGRR